MEQPEKKVKKPIEAIQCSNTFSLLQRKIYNVLLSNSEGNFRPDVTHQIGMHTLCKLLEYKSHDYLTLKNRFRELRRMDLEWDIINENGHKVWTNTSPLSLARIIEGEGICEYEFTKSLLPYLEKPAQYAKFSLAIQAKFKSSYGLALYENCERYRNLPSTRAFDVEVFRKLMGLKDNQYTEFFAMKRRVIDPAVREVNAYADFWVEPEYKKIGKRTIKIKFIIKPKIARTEKNAGEKKGVKAELVKAESLSTIAIILREKFNLKEIKIAQLLKKYGEAYLQEKVEYIFGTAKFKAGEIDNLGAYLITALQQNYQTKISSQMLLEKQREEKVLVESHQEQLASLEKELSALKISYSKFQTREVIKLLHSSLQEEFAQYLQETDTQTYQIYRQKKYASFAVSYALRQFVKIRHPLLLEKIPSFNEYLKQINERVYEYYLKQA